MGNSVDGQAQVKALTCKMRFQAWCSTFLERRWLLGHTTTHVPGRNDFDLSVKKMDLIAGGTFYIGGSM